VQRALAVQPCPTRKGRACGRVVDAREPRVIGLAPISPPRGTRPPR
jgi:hypothetical protein